MLVLGVEVATDRPTLICIDSVSRPKEEHWDQPDRWGKYIADKICNGGLRGVILPLELETPWSARQDLYGLVLLEWLRWSTPEAVELPVMVLAWQSLENVLRRRPSLYLLHEYTCFRRLPEETLTFKPFQPTGNPFPKSGVPWSYIEGAWDDEAARVTHHDLANDYYAADRLWVGYQHALAEHIHHAKRQDRKKFQEALRAAQEMPVHWKPLLEATQNTPSFRKFQAATKTLEFPCYPLIPEDEAADLLEAHVLGAIPSSLRILMVDDCFQKGLADTLLNILFPGHIFSAQKDHEWVYAEKVGTKRWARFVCVDSVARARCWLLRWGELTMPSSEVDWNEFLEWSEGWLGHAPRWENYKHFRGSPDQFEFDDKNAEPKKTHTALILDLRLGDRKLDHSYRLDDLSSIKLRRQIRSASPQTPILMFTASRQALNFAQAMGKDWEVDGWLIKESPDIKADPQNSANAALYLLKQVHLLLGEKEWYRDEMNWCFGDRLRYSRWRRSVAFEDDLQDLHLVVAVELEEIASGAYTQSKFPRHNEYQRTKTPSGWSEVQRVIFNRMIITGAVLLSASGGPEKLTVNWPDLLNLLPFRKYKKATFKRGDRLHAFHELQVFSTTAWIAPEDGILRSLLDHELAWLRDFSWPDDRKDAVLRALERKTDF